MTRAEERALEAYPVREDFYRKDGILRSEPLDLNLEKRGFYQQGYEQAEKDLALTVEDIKTILDISFWNDDPEKILDEYNRIKYGD
jgi:hypothetical protein